VSNTMRLAEELGARTLILPLSSTSPTVAGTVLEFARQHNITKVIAGKPLRPFWQDLLRGSIVDHLIRHSGNIDVYVISSAPPDQKTAPEETAWRPHRPWRRYLYSLLLVAVATGLSHLIGSGISPTNLVMIYLLVVVVTAVYLGRGPAILASAASVLAFDFFFVPPRLTLSVSDTEYLLTFAGLLMVGIVISYLTVRAREQAEAAQKREADTAALYSLSRDLASANGLDMVIKTIVVHMDEAFGRDALIFFPDKTGNLQSYHRALDYQLDATEIAASVWAYQRGEPAGRGTNTLPGARARYVPLRASERTLGVLGAKPKAESVHLTPDQQRLLEAFASQTAQAIERVQLAEQAQQAELLHATERLQSALLNSISHDLRTPLVSITGALTSLQDSGIALDEEIRTSLIETARQEADRLNRLVGNLLSMTRLEGGAIKVVPTPGDVQDAIGAALEQLTDRLGDRPVDITVPEGFPLVPMDFPLMVQVLVNVIDNAIKYSPPGSQIEIEARLEEIWACITVTDHGIGIPDEDMERVFDKFYRVQRPDQVTGTGLGLAICKGIMEAHHGQIAARHQTGGGTIISMRLPA